MSELLDYWAERAREAINVELMEDAQAAAEIQRIATMMCADIMKEILAYYAKLATAEGIDWKEAKKIADTFDVEAFQAKAKQLVESKDFSKEANKALKRYNTAMYVSREKLLKQQLHMIVVDSYSKQENVVKSHLEDSIERTMKHQSGILGADVKIKKTDIQAIVNADFKNVTWSKRLWTDQAQLQTEVEKMASNVMTRGRHPKEYVKNIRSIAEPKLNQIKGKVTYNGKRLLITEAARVQSEAQRLHYIEILGEDGEYTFIAKMDEKTSAICKAHNGKVYKVKEMVPGVNAPPLHPHCRSTTAPRPDKDWRKNFFARKKKENSSEKVAKESGALNNINDPYGSKRREHANIYYNSVRNRNKETEISTVSEKTGINKATIKRVYEHIFENEYNLEGGKKRFDPDYEMSQSWYRLREGKDIKEKDLVMVRHEALEHYLMNKYNYSYKEAHKLTETKYNYSELL